MNEIKIINILQAVKYTKLGIQPKRIEEGKGGCIVFVYEKNEELKSAYKKWTRHEIEL